MNGCGPRILALLTAEDQLHVDYRHDYYTALCTCFDHEAYSSYNLVDDNTLYQSKGPPVLESIRLIAKPNEYQSHILFW